MKRRSEEAAEQFLKAEKEREDRKKNSKPLKPATKNKDQLIHMLNQRPQISKLDIPIEWIDISENIRSRIDTEEPAFRSLVESIKEVGLLQPPVVRKVDNKLELLSGHRRVEAWRFLNRNFPTEYKDVTVLLHTVEDGKRPLAQLIENANRKNLNPFDTADAYSKVQKEGGYMMKELAEIFGKNPDYIGRLIKISSWPDEVKVHFKEDPRITYKFLNEVAAKNLVSGSIEDMKSTIEILLSQKKLPPSGKNRKPRTKALDEDIVEKIKLWSSSNSLAPRDRTKFKKVAESVYKIPQEKRALIKDFISSIL